MSDQSDLVQAFSGEDSYITGHLGEQREQYLEALAPPIFMTSLHTAGCLQEYMHAPEGKYIYGRLSNPTTEICEKKIAGLERAKRAFLYASGMGAATAAILAVCAPGDHIVCVHNAYGGVQEFLNTYGKDTLHYAVTYVHGDAAEEIEAAVTERTKLIILESPGSATFSLVDLRRIAAFAKTRGIITYTDNSYCSPIFQKPLTMGIDLVMHSGTKYLGGHGDLISGVLATSNDALIEKLYAQRVLFGNIIGPMEAWLMIRGLRTLGARMREHERIATEVAHALEREPLVKKVYYPGLKSHPQHALASAQQTGSSGLLSFELNAGVEEAEAFVNALKLFKIGPSWGGYESLAVMPLYGYSEEYASWYGASRGLIRIHCGLEGADLLLTDLRQALSTIK